MRKLYSHLIKQITIWMFSIALLTAPNVSKADEVGDVLDAIFSITCESQGMGALIGSGTGHTCIPDAWSSVIVAGIISPYLYLPTMLRLKIGFEKIDALRGNCLRTNRANPKDGETGLTFAMCSNVKLMLYRGELFAQAIVGVGRAMFSGGGGGDIWENLKELLMVDYNRFHQIYRNKKIGDSGIFFDMPMPPIVKASPVLPWRVVKNNDKICVATYTIFGTLLPVGCKYIREPYPTSIYKEFFENGIVNAPATSLTENANQIRIPSDMNQFFNCSIGISGCAKKATAYSQTLLPMSSVIIECIRSTLINTLISSSTCVINQPASNPNPSIQYGSSAFNTFQLNMQRAVMAFLTLYVIFIGFKLLLGQGQVPPAGEVIMYGVKIILVIYFSVGININGQGHFDGMVRWVFPLLLNAANEMANWFMQASPSNLCTFPIQGTSYENGMSRLALWDSLDCKVMHYLGIDTLSTMFLGNTSGDNFGNSVPPYIFLLIPALISGKINLVMLALSYPLMVMSVGAYLVSSFAVCLIAITVLAVLAPIYVPLALFDQTKGYFQSWYKLMISFTLQPIVVASFMTIMFAVFDQGFYTGCEFEGVLVRKVDAEGRSTQLKQFFTLKTAKENYNRPENFEKCKKSLGWILNAPWSTLINGNTNPGTNGMRTITYTPRDMTFDDYQGSYAILNAVKQVSGVFFGYIALIGNINAEMIVSLFVCLLMLYLMRELSGQLSEFAADIADSASVASAAISPRAFDGSTIKNTLEDRQDGKKASELANRRANLSGGNSDASPKALGSKDGGDTSPKALSSGDSDASPKIQNNQGDASPKIQIKNATDDESSV